MDYEEYIGCRVMGADFVKKIKIYAVIMLIVFIISVCGFGGIVIPKLPDINNDKN